jgi:hypothetical protein
MRRTRAAIHCWPSIAIALVMILLGALIPSRPVGATGTLDQFFEPTAQNGGFGSSFGAGDERMTGQTFTAGVTGTLTQLDLYISLLNGASLPTAVPLTVQVQTVMSDGAPSGTVLGQGSVLASQVPIEPERGWVSVPIRAPSVAGNHYAIVLTTADPRTVYGVYHTAQPVGGTPYSGGQLWFFATEAGGWFSTGPDRYESFARTYVTAAPTITASASPGSIWPPDHKDVPVTVTVEVTAGGAPLTMPPFVLTNVQVTGGSASDITGFPVGQPSVQGTMKANKDAVYTLTYTATDQAGNSAVATVTVVVPHDQGHGQASPQAAPAGRSIAGTTRGAASGAGTVTTAPAQAPTGR